MTTPHNPPAFDPPREGDRVLRQLRMLFAAKNAERLTDAELVRRFADTRDEAAFAVIVRRHGDLVLRACRNIAGADADDAFQATFLILARKAAHFRSGQSLAGWLHGIARRCARNLKKNAMRRRRREQAVQGARPPESPALQAALNELQAILDEEIQRLPAKYQGPFLLCCLEGKSRAEAAQMLGCVEGTLASRLATAREMLQKRLTARGVTLTAALAATALAPTALSGAVPVALAHGAIEAALAFTTGKVAAAASAPALAIANGVMKTMLITKLSSAAILTVALSMAACTAGGLVAPQSAGDLPKRNAEPVRQTPAVKNRPDPKAENPIPTDLRGDPLPEAALARFGSARMRHGGKVRASALAPDGKMLATSGQYSVAVWNLETGNLIHRLSVPRSETYVHPGLDFSPDGSKLASIRNSNLACIWDLRTGKELHRIERNSKPDGSHTLFASSCRFINGGNDLRMATFATLETLRLGSKQIVNSVDVSNRFEIFSSVSSSVRELSPDGKFYFRVVAKEVILGDADTGKEIARIAANAAHDGIENGLAFSPDGNSFALVHNYEEIHHRQLPSGKLLVAFPLPKSWLHLPRDGEFRLDFAADGRTLFFGTFHGIIRRWDLVAGKELPPLSKLAESVAGLHTLPDGKSLLSVGHDGVIRRWDLTTGRQLPEPDSYDGKTTAAYSANGRWAAIGDGLGRIDLWDISSGKVFRTIQPEGAAVASLAFAPSGDRLAMAESSGTIRFWKVPSGEAGDVWTYDAKRLNASCDRVQFSSDGRLLAVNDRPRQIRVIEVANGNTLWVGPNSDGEAFSPDGRTMVTTNWVDGNFNEMNFVDSSSGRVHAKVNLGPSRGMGVGRPVFTPDGRRLAVVNGGSLVVRDGSDGSEIQRIWNFEDKREQVFWRRNDYPCTVAFSADGKWLASGDTAGEIIVWEMATNKEVLRFSRHDGEISALAFSPDGRTLSSFASDSQGYRWNLMPKSSAVGRVALTDLWDILDQADAAAAYRAQWQLIANGKESVPFLQKRFSPAPAIDRAKILQWIADVDSPKFPVRDAANKHLENAGPQALGPIQKALAGEVSLEARRRLEQIAKKLDAPLTLASGRAIQVLELIGTPEAGAVLESLAAGARGTREADEAKASLERLSRRVGPRP